MPDTAIQWTDTITVNTNSTSLQRVPRIIQLENGDIIVAWETNDPADQGYPDGYDIMAQRYDQAGNAIGGEFRLNTGWITDDERDASLASIPGNGFLMAYEDFSTANAIRIETFDIDGTRNDSKTVAFQDSETGRDYQNPEIAVSSATSALVVYDDVIGGNRTLYARVYNPTTNEFTTTATKLFLAIVSFDGSVTVLNNGNYVVAGTVNNGETEIQFSIYDSDGSWVTGRIEIGTTGSNGFGDYGARVEALSGGGFVIAWQNVDTNDRDLLFQVFNADGTTSGVQRTFPAVGSAADENYVDHSITALSDGGFAILADNQTENDLRLQRFDSSGVTVGSLITLSDLSEGQVDITLLADGRMAMVYNNGSDIKMEIFDTRDGPTAGENSIGIGTIGNDVMSESTTGFSNGIFAHDGDDTVTISIIATNGEVFDGGDGTDTLVLTVSTYATMVDLEAGTHHRIAVPSIVDSVLNFENVTASNSDDALYGTNGANILTGLDGNDVLWGRGGADTMIGGAGDDTYIIEDVSDVAVETASNGTDTVYTSVDLTLWDNIETGVNNSTGTSGGELRGNALDNVLIMTNTSAIGSSLIYGGSGNDTVYIQNNTAVYGEFDNDTIVINGDNNQVFGGEGNDVYIVNSSGANNAITEYTGQGTDTVYAYSASFTLTDNIETLVLITFDANFAQNGTGNAENNTIIGGGSNNTLTGLGGNDFLIGGGGDDILVGGTGLDVMQGNVGEDSFLYNNFLELGDIIQDWVNTDDSFHFSGLAFGVGIGTSLVEGVNFISSTAPVSVAAQATFLWDSDDYDLYYDGDGTGTGASPVLVASLQDFTTVDVTDFVFF